MTASILRSLLLASAGFVALTEGPAFAQSDPLAPCRESVAAAERRLSEGRFSEEVTSRVRGLLTEARAAVDRRSVEDCRRLAADVDRQLASTAASPTGPAGVANVVVQQAKPEIIVQQRPPQVTVQQHQPRIIVDVPPPQITIVQAQPRITVEMPPPDVSVHQQQPEIVVNVPTPQIQILPFRPEVSVMRAEPEVRIQQAQAQVTVHPATQAQVEVQQAEPQIRVEKAAAAQPEASAPRDVPTPGPRPTGSSAFTASAAPTAAPSAALQGAIFGLPAQRLIGAEVVGSRGERIGHVDSIVMAGGAPNREVFAVTEIGGFLGIGDRKVMVPLRQVEMRGDKLALVNMTKEQIERLPAYERDRYQPVDDRARPLRDVLAAR